MGEALITRRGGAIIWDSDRIKIEQNISGSTVYVTGLDEAKNYLIIATGASDGSSPADIATFVYLSRGGTIETLADEDYQSVVTHENIRWRDGSLQFSMNGSWAGDNISVTVIEVP